MARVVSVMPADDGWEVFVEGEPDRLMLRPGSKAEEKAVQIAKSFAWRGEAATVRVQLPDGSLAARFITSAAPSEGGWRWRTPAEVQAR